MKLILMFKNVIVPIHKSIKHNTYNILCKSIRTFYYNNL